MTPSELRALVAAMTPGPWEFDGDVINGADGSVVVYDVEALSGNLRGIATLRDIAPALVELWEAVEAYRVSRESSVGPSIEAAHAALLAAAKRVGEQA